MSDLTIYRPRGADLPQIGRWVTRGGRRRFSPTCGRGSLVAPDGSIIWQGEWEPNGLHDEGEKSILDVYFLEQANPSKYLMLHNGTGVSELADTDTMASLTESETPATHGYSRQQVTSGNWSTPSLDSGDMRTGAAEKTFGPNSDAGAWDITHVCMVTVSTGTAGLLLISTPLSAEQTVQQNISFKWTQYVKLG